MSSIISKINSNKDQHQPSIWLTQNTESSKQCYYATNVSNKRNNIKHENAKPAFERYYGSKLKLSMKNQNQHTKIWKTNSGGKSKRAKITSKIKARSTSMWHTNIMKLRGLSPRGKPNWRSRHWFTLPSTYPPTFFFLNGFTVKYFKWRGNNVVWIIGPIQTTKYN